MSNFTVNGVYSYTSANLYSYLGRVPSNERTLKEAFDEFANENVINANAKIFLFKSFQTSLIHKKSFNGVGDCSRQNILIVVVIK